MLDVVKTVASYHPRKAVRSSVEGSFMHHIFPDGGEMVVRRSFQERLFGEKWGLVKVLRDSRRSVMSRSVFHCRIGGADFIVRRYEQQHITRPLKPGFFMVKLARIAGKKVRVEPPVMELLTASGERLIVTRQVSEKNVYETLKEAGSLKENSIKQISIKAARIIAKLHANGIGHGHPHFGNWHFSKGGSLVITDPKFMVDFMPVSLSEAHVIVEKVRGDSVPDRGAGTHPVQADLCHLVYWGRHELSPLGVGEILDEYLAAYTKEYSRKK